MKIELRKFGIVDSLRILLMTLDKKYSEEREDTFFSYLLKLLKSLVQRKDSYEFVILVNGKFAGNIGLFNPKKGVYEMGYMVLREYRKKGVATQAINKIINFGFGELKVSKVIAITDYENKASQKVLRKNKFTLLKRDQQKNELIWKRLR